MATPSKQVHSVNQAGFGEDGVVRCRCVPPRAALYLISHTTTNPDRPFYKCEKDKDDRTNCKYFKWADELEAERARRNSGSVQAENGSPQAPGPSNARNSPAAVAASASPFSTRSVTQANHFGSNGRSQGESSVTPRATNGFGSSSGYTQPDSSPSTSAGLRSSGMNGFDRNNGVDQGPESESGPPTKKARYSPRSDHDEPQTPSSSRQQLRSYGNSSQTRSNTLGRTTQSYNPSFEDDVFSSQHSNATAYDAQASPSPSFRTANNEITATPSLPVLEGGTAERLEALAHTIVDSGSLILTLVSDVQKLERKVSALQKSNDSKMLRIQQLEREVERLQAGNYEAPY